KETSCFSGSGDYSCTSIDDIIGPIRGASRPAYGCFMQPCEGLGACTESASCSLIHVPDPQHPFAGLPECASQRHFPNNADPGIVVGPDRFVLKGCTFDRGTAPAACQTETGSFMFGSSTLDTPAGWCGTYNDGSIGLDFWTNDMEVILAAPNVTFPSQFTVP